MKRGVATPTKENFTPSLEIENMVSYAFVLGQWTVCYEDGVWWAELTDGDEDDEIIVIENDEIHFELSSELLGIGLTDDLFRQYKDIVTFDN